MNIYLKSTPECIHVLLNTLYNSKIRKPLMPSKGYIWDDEYRERYYSSPKVQVHLETFKSLVKQPKSKETKDKMSAAKKDVSKTQEQKDAMAATQRLRHKLRAEVAASQPELTKQEQWAVVKEMIRKLKDGV